MRLLLPFAAVKLASAHTFRYGLIVQEDRLADPFPEDDDHENCNDKTTPRLIQFHTLKNAVNPPFLGGFSIFNTVVA